MPDDPSYSPKHMNQLKVLLDDEFEELLRCAARIHRTKKSILAREILKSWLMDVAADSKPDRRTA